MAHNYSRPIPSPTPSLHSLDREDARAEKVHHHNKDGRRPNPPTLAMRRAATMSPTFHIDPERSSSSDNGSMSHPFQFPPHPSPINPVRDSVTTTHQSSSVYPARSISSYSYSNNSPPSPSSPSSSSCFAPSVRTNGTGATDEFNGATGLRFALDPDDVSYRLRLLVKNNYFLPPAHSKPSQSELSSLSAAAELHHSLPTKVAPSFRDIFRVGKPNKATPAPTGLPASKPVPQPVPPRLRQVKSHNAINPRPVHARKDTVLSNSTSSNGSNALMLAAGGPQERKGRVVVIREKIDDLFLTAKEAEVHMHQQQRQMEKERQQPASRSEDGRGREEQTRPNRRARSSDSRRSHARSETDEEFIVDPTDAVDLPSYSFQPQASGLMGLGLGVDASGLSAGALADQLPPTAHMTMSKEDMLWRKALLHQAVGLSMMSIPPPSTPSSSPRPDKVIRKTPSGKSTKSGASSGIGFPSGEGASPMPRSANTSTAGLQMPIVENLPAAVTSKKRDKKPQHLMVDVHSGHGRERSATHPASQPQPPNQNRLHPHSHSHSYHQDDDQSHRAGPPSPVPRSETPAVPTEALRPPPPHHVHRPGTSESFTSSDQQHAYTWRYPVSPDLPDSRPSGEGLRLTMSSEEGRRRGHAWGGGGGGNHSQARSLSRPPTFPPNEAETIRKTLSKPLLSEENAHDSERSSEYFTPGSNPASPAKVAPAAAQRSAEEVRKTASAKRRTKSVTSVTSGSAYSDDEERVADSSKLEEAEQEDARPHEEQGEELTRPRRILSYPKKLAPTPESDVFPEGSGNRSGSTGHSRPSYALSETATINTAGTTGSRPSNDSRIPRRSLTESRVSMYSTSFGPPGLPHRQRTMSPPPSSRPATGGMSFLPSTGSGFGLHSLDGVAEVEPPASPPPFLLGLEPTTSHGAPPVTPTYPLSYGRVPVGTTSALVTRRPKSGNPQTRNSEMTVSPNRGGGYWDVSPLEGLPLIPHNNGSFLDLDVGGGKSSDEDPSTSQQTTRLGPRSAVDVGNDTDSATRSRVSSYTGTIVPNPQKGVFAAGSHHRDSQTSFLSMRLPNSSNPYLPQPDPFDDEEDRRKPVTNTVYTTPSTPVTGTYMGAGSSFFSALGNTLRGDKTGIRRSSKPGGVLPISSSAAGGSGDLLRYSKNPKARSTPTLAVAAPSYELGRRSNVSDRLYPPPARGFSVGSVERGADEWQGRSPDPEVRKLAGLVLQHIQAERDLIRSVAARGKAGAAAGKT